MMWVIRGTNANNGEDFAMVVEANSLASAECWALKRGVPAVVIAEASEEDVANAKRNHQLWKFTPDSRYTAFGRPVAAKQLVCLLLAGVMTAGLNFVRLSNAGRTLRVTTSSMRG